MEIKFNNSDDAVRYGAKATLNQIIELKRLRSEAISLCKVEAGRGDMNKALEMAFNSQFYREAIEAAIGKRCH